jgi:transcriptional regulator with XRE-family HTH domain
MDVIAGRSLGITGAPSPPTPKRGAVPADSARLATLVKVANAAGLRSLGLGLPKVKCGPCDGCDYQAICRARGALGLWAPCEKPSENDLLTLANVLEDHMSENEPLALAERLRALREEQGLNWSQVGRRIGMTGNTVRNWENGILPTMASLVALAWAFGLTPEALFDGVDITPAIIRRYAAIFEKEYSGVFTFAVEVTVAGADRAEIVKAAKRALRQAGDEFAGVPRVEALPEKLAVTLDGPQG